MDGRETEMGSDGWDEFVNRAKDFIISGEFERKEIVPKLEIGYKLAKARAAVLCSDDNWPELVENGFGFGLVYGSNRSSFLSWIKRSPDDAGEALKAIWTKDDLPVYQRIRDFCERFPGEIVGNGGGVRMSIAAQLLLGLDSRRYTPFSIDRLMKACRQTGYDPPGPNEDEAALYTHLQDFLDRFIEKAQAHKLNLRHRLDAFVVVWHFVDELPKLDSGTIGSLLPSANELYLPLNFLKEIETLLNDKRQVIFQGPPGTGKTYVAQAIAECLVGGNEERVTLVQFHPSYAYEDFVRGFRPTLKDGQTVFELQDGPLLHAARKAREDAVADQDVKHFLIIDEINRGNLAKVFGELYFLLEYRDRSIRMQYQRDAEEDFSLPRNLYIIGTMNTADRSIGLIDLALRRRFYFVEFHPDVEPVKSVLGRWLDQNASEMKGVAKIVQKANELLKDDRHAAIGPSYFMKESLDRTMVERIWKHSVVPYIEERLFGDENRLEEFEFKKICTEVAPELLPTVYEEQNDEEASTTPNGAINAENQP